MCWTSQLDKYLENNGKMCINFINYVSTAETWLVP